MADLKPPVLVVDFTSAGSEMTSGSFTCVAKVENRASCNRI